MPDENQRIQDEDIYMISIRLYTFKYVFFGLGILRWNT